MSELSAQTGAAAEAAAPPALPAFLVVDKPEGITSHDVVAMVRAVLGVKKVGHTGTLDPFATGVLPLALGSATRLIQYLDEDLKVYDATIQLGSATDTGDCTGQVIRSLPVPALDEAQVLAVLAGFKGPQMQTPPQYSAVKVDGRALYRYAREGKEVAVEPRPIRIDGIDLISLGSDSLRVRIRCGRGTYARVLADDIAQALGTAGHLSALRRDQSGPFVLDQALDLPTLGRFVGGREDWPAVLRPGRGEARIDWRPRDAVRADVRPYLLGASALLTHLPMVELSPGQRDLLNRAGHPPAVPPGVPEGTVLRAVFAGRVLALVQATPGRAKLVWSEREG